MPGDRGRVIDAPLGQGGEHDLKHAHHLCLGQMRPQAAVRPNAEAQVAVGMAVQAHIIGMCEFAFVTIA